MAHGWLVLMQAVAWCLACLGGALSPLDPSEMGSGLPPTEETGELPGVEEGENHGVLGSNWIKDEVNLLTKITSHALDLVNISLSHDEANCSALEIGQYSTLSMPTRAAFGFSFADELSVLMKVRYSLKEDTSLLTILNVRGHVLLQIQINPHVLVLVSERRGHYEFPITTLTDGEWHRIALGISADGVQLYVDCGLVENISWTNFFGMGVTTDGLLMVGGLIEPFEIPFTGSLEQLIFVMGDAGAAKQYCKIYNETCLSSFNEEQVYNQSTTPMESFTDPPQIITPDENHNESFSINSSISPAPTKQSLILGGMPTHTSGTAVSVLPSATAASQYTTTEQAPRGDTQTSLKPDLSRSTTFHFQVYLSFSCTLLLVLLWLQP